MWTAAAHQLRDALEAPMWTQNVNVDLKPSCHLANKVPLYGCQPLAQEPRIVCEEHQSAFIARSL